MMNADEPAISVRSRSKNAALGPLPTMPRYALGVGRRGVVLDVVERLDLLVHGARLGGGLLRARAARPSCVVRSLEDSLGSHGSAWPPPGSATARSYATRFGMPSRRATAAAASRRDAPAASSSRSAARMSSSPGASPDTGAPATTTTYSPRGSPRSTSPSVPWTTVSYSLVSSRATATGRSAPNAAARSAIVRGDAVRRLVQHDRARLGRQLGQPLGTGPTRPRQEPLEHEPPGRQPADDERGDEGRRTGHGRDVVAGVEHGRDQPLARVADARRPGVGHDGDVAAVAEHRRAPPGSAPPRCARCRRPAGRR